MGAFNPISGKEGSVQVGTATYAFKKWELAMDTNLPVVNNFTSAYQQLVSGVTSGTLTLEGPWDVSNMPLTTGNSYNFTLAVNNSVNLQVTAFVANITPSDDIDDAARVKVTAKTSGSFTAAIV